MLERKVFEEMKELSKVEEEIREKSRMKSHYETFQSEITEYLTSKLEMYNIPKHTIMEIAQYVMQGTALVANDEVRRAFRSWEKQMLKNKKRRSDNDGGNTLF